MTKILFSSLQVGITLVAFYIDDPGATMTMPILTQRLVELHCYMSTWNLTFPLAFNLFLLTLCALFGFLTRKLPDNYNESWFVFISVTTTLFVWVAFLPTHMMAFYAYHKTALLSLVLYLNASVTLLCLFVPKLFAVFFVDEKEIKITNFSPAQLHRSNVAASNVTIVSEIT